MNPAFFPSCIHHKFFLWHGNIILWCTVSPWDTTSHLTNIHSYNRLPQNYIWPISKLWWLQCPWCHLPLWPTTVMLQCCPSPIPLHWNIAVIVPAPHILIIHCTYLPFEVFWFSCWERRAGHMSLDRTEATRMRLSFYPTCLWAKTKWLPKCFVLLP